MSQVRRNLYTNIISLFINVIVGLYYTPYLIKELGLAAYGIVPLTMIINQYINVLTSSLTGSLARFYTIKLQQNDFQKASSVLTTVLILLGFILLVFIPILAILIYNINNLFSIPQRLLTSTRWLFFFTLFSFFISLFSSIMNITLYAQNRLDIMNVIKCVRVGLKLVLVIIFFESISVNLMFVGAANLCTEILILIFSFYSFKKYSPRGIQIKWSLFDKVLLSSVLSMTFWTIIHQIGDVGLYRVDNLVVNRNWGTELSGALGAISEFGVYVSLVVGVISSLFGPIILIAYSKKEHENVQSLALNNSLIVGILTAIIIGCLLGYCDYVLGYWLGEAYTVYSQWFILKLISLPFYAAAGIYAFVNRAWNCVKYPAICTVVFGSINVAILYFVAHYLRLSSPVEQIKWMLLLSSIIIVIQSYGVNSYFFNKNYRHNIASILKIFIKICVAIFIAYIISYYFLKFYIPTSLLDVAFSLLLVGLLTLIISIFVLFNSTQRSVLLSLIR